MRSLITKWQDLAETHSEGDRLSIIVLDERTGRLKHINAQIYDVDHEGEPGWDEAVETWNFDVKEFEKL